ncbi:MAG: DUF4041 domain-containing protein [Oscillospiraceae bacterium]|nr:DUF4041 domain-containing protein [Oscillospiraceae bacterium]
MGIMDLLKAKENERLKAENENLKNSFTPQQEQLYDINQAIVRKQQELKSLSECVNNLQREHTDLQYQISVKKQELITIDDEIAFQEYGLYKPTYEFANSDLYKEKLAEIRTAQKNVIKNDKAVTGNTNWTVNGSQSQGKKMLKDMQKLLLRAFNTECDDTIDNVKVSNFEKSRERIIKSAEQISKLGVIMQICVTEPYVNLKLSELALALDFQQKKQEEKEHIKELREQQREEAKAQKEIEEARKKLQKEQTHYQNAYAKLLEQIARNGESEELIAKRQELETQLADTEKAISDVDYREANKRAGYVYIISNIGAFGENIYKIGMTRRLEPLERISELSDASVPFNFDVHALIFTDDAPGLESALHTAFESKKVNKINHRREFFRVSLDEIKAEVRKNFDKTVEWVDVPEAEQYRQSLIM